MTARRILGVTASEALEEYRAAAARIRGVVLETPLVAADGAADLWLKLETLQPIHSFKLRGVFHAVASLSAEERAAGLSTVSAGNTAQALAWAGRHFGVTARSIMPERAPRTKIDAVERLGGTPVLVSVDEVFRFLREHGWEDEPYAFIHPWTDRDLALGHGSLGLEILEQCPDVETVYLSVGGGGLLAGVGGAIKASRPEVRIVAVEPEGCPALAESLRQGAPAQVPCQTICDGIAVPYITDEMYPILAELVDDVVLVSEAAVRRAVRRLALADRIVAEPSGAIGVAAAEMEDPKRRGVAVAPITGGSIDRAKLVDILSEEDAPGS